MVRRGAPARRGRRAVPLSPTVKAEGHVPAVATPKETVASKPRGNFRGKLSHTSPIPNSVSEKKITVFFSSVKSEDVPEVDNEIEIIEDEATSKTLALHKVFGRQKGSSAKPTTPDTTPHKIKMKCEENGNCLESSPHKIQMKVEDYCEIVAEVVAPIPIETAPDLVDERKIKAMKAKRKLNVNQSLNQDAPVNHKLTEYFGVRRSVRKPKTTILEEKQRSLEEAVLSGKEDGLMVHNFPGKGRGVIANRLFRRGEFVVEYSGDLIDTAEARVREMEYAADQNTGCYMYYFQHKNQSYCIDATAESSRLGRLVNHSRNGNLMPKVIEIKDRPFLLLVARVDIAMGEELLYDYGDRSRVSLKHHPWLAL